MARRLPVDAAPGAPLLMQSAAAASEDGTGHEEHELPFSFSMAFQPIIDIERRQVCAYEALVHGPEDRPARWVLAHVTPDSRYIFDQRCRVRAIELAAKLGIAGRGARLAVNFMPGAVDNPPRSIERTLQVAQEFAFPLSALTLEITEAERVPDPAHLQRIVAEYRRQGLTVALDDFGSGFSGLNLLAELEELDEVKLDACLIRGVDSKPRARIVLRRIVELCQELKVHVVGEGVETPVEFKVLRSCGISRMQGYLFARPLFEGLPEVTWPPD